MWTELANLNALYEQQQFAATQMTIQLTQTHEALIEEQSSLKAALAIRREHGAHLERMAAFWQQCEVSIPNKPVPVPRAMMFRKKQHQQQLISKLELLKVATVESQDEVSTSAGSGSQRSQEEENLLTNKAFKKTTIRD